MSEVMFQRIDTLDASDSQQALSLLKELTVWSISQQFCNPATKQLLIHMDAIPGTIQLSRGQHTFLSISGRLSSDFIQNSRCLFVAVVIEMTLVHNNSAWKAPRNGNYYDYMWGRTYFMAGPLGQRWCRESSSTSTIELTTVSQSWLSHWLTPLADRLPEQYVVPLIDHRFECKMVVPQPSTLGEDHGNGCILQIRLSLKDTRERLWCAHTDKQMVIQCIQNNE
ncbi:hypothetical protein BDF22DRAFT_745119 [Syncephalis plumigaleata]|nr:hypothetical protein BDF22DRAFT_745119 [Syncephalis plumigaleata]